MKSFLSNSEKAIQKVPKSDEHFDSTSNKSGESSGRGVTEFNFKNMIPVARSPGSRSSKRSSAGPFSTGARSSDSEGNRSPLSGKSSFGIASMTKDALKGIENEETIPIFNFQYAITILGTRKSIENFYKIFIFTHRLDLISTEDEEIEEKFGCVFRLMNDTTKKNTIVNVSKISKNEELTEISKRYNSIKQHSYIILYEEELLKQWLDIISNIGLKGNLIILFDEEEEGLYENQLLARMKKVEDKVSDIFIEAYIKAMYN
eukprot:gene5270-8888_t